MVGIRNMKKENLASFLAAESGFCFISYSSDASSLGEYSCLKLKKNAEFDNSLRHAVPTKFLYSTKLKLSVAVKVYLEKTMKFLLQYTFLCC